MTPINLADLDAKASQFNDLIAMMLDDPHCGCNLVPLNRQNLQWLFESAIDQ